MEAALYVMWWIGLLGALALTLVLLKQVSLLLRVLRQIHQLGTHVRNAAEGLSKGAEAVDLLRPAADPAGQFAASAGELRIVCAAIRERLGQLVNDSS